MSFSFFHKSFVLSTFVASTMMAAGLTLQAQDPQQQAPAATTAPAQQSTTFSSQDAGKKRKSATKTEKKDEKVQQPKDTKQALSRQKRNSAAALVGQDVTHPDKVLYDKAVAATAKGHYDVARLDLQTMLNTYPDSEYQMRAKLAIADSWYKESGSAALSQAEAEYKDFITFFPNVPEAAEAQMRVGDIYFRQMDKPDRDYQKAMHAEEEYRNMVQQFPQSTLVPEAKQRLREVQEVLATREASIAEFYASHENWNASTARYETIATTYPLYSHMDEVLIGIGDAYAAQAKKIREAKGADEAVKARLEKSYDDMAAAAYTRVITQYAAMSHVDDAKDKLTDMGRPVPEATKEQMAASQALEGSRSQYKLSDRAMIMFLKHPDVVQTAHLGEPTMVDPRPMTAPDVNSRMVAIYNAAVNPNAALPMAKPAVTTAGGDSAPAVTLAVPAAPLAFQDVESNDGAATSNSGANSMTGSSAATRGGGATAGGGVGLSIVSTGEGSSQPTGESVGLKAVGPTNNAPLPAVEKPADATDTVNDVAGVKTPVAQAAPTDGKKAKKPGINKSEESSSTNKKKKGLSKLNPF